MNRAATSLAVVLAVALPAAAQDGKNADYRAGYRAGYDDGFQAGLDKAQRDVPPPPPMMAPPPPPPPSMGPIRVTRAVYGTNAKRCDATRWAARMANGRMSATLDVSNNICGDPSPGDRKSLDVTYVCGEIAKSATANEHRSLSLDCSP